MKYVLPVIAAALVSFEASAQSLEKGDATRLAEGADALVVAAAKPARMPGKARMSAPRFTPGVGPAEGMMGIAKVAPTDAVDTPATAVEGAGDGTDAVIELDAGVIAAVAGSKADLATLSQACMPDLPQVVLASAADFRADPGLWIESRSDAPRRLHRDMRSIALSDPQLVTLLEADLLGDMEAETRKAVGVGVGRAARTCNRMDPDIMDLVEKSVMDTKDNAFVEGYLLEVSRTSSRSDSLSVEQPRTVAVAATADFSAPERRSVRLSSDDALSISSASDASRSLANVQTVASVNSPGDVRVEIEEGTVRLDIPFLDEFDGSETVTVRNVAPVSPTRP